MRVLAATASALPSPVCNAAFTFGNHWNPTGTEPAIKSGTYCAMLR